MPQLYKGLLISTQRNFEQNAASEIQYTLTKELELDAESIVVKKTGISGLITVQLEGLDILSIMDKLIELEDDGVYYIYCLKIRPILIRIPTDIEELQKTILDNLSMIKGSFKVDIYKRHVNLKSTDIISAIASNITNKVDLENPDTLVLIEIIGDKLGLSIMPPKMMYATKKAISGGEKETEETNWFL